MMEAAKELSGAGLESEDKAVHSGESDGDAGMAQAGTECCTGSPGRGNDLQAEQVVPFAPEALVQEVEQEIVAPSSREGGLKRKRQEVR
jgi:hypothetical protein